MSVQEAADMMSDLENACVRFSYDDTSYYVNRVQHYLDLARQFSSGVGLLQPGPLINVSDSACDLPIDFQSRLDGWASARPEHSPFVKRVIRLALVATLN